MANTFGRGLTSAGVPVLPFDPDRLKRRASRIARWDEPGDDRFDEALQTLCDSLEKDAHLSLYGRVALHDRMMTALVARLRRLKLRHERPHAFADLRPPVIVTGMPRAGTTLLHRLLSLATGARALATWEVQQPVAPAGRDLRRARVKAQLQVLKAVIPEIDVKHAIGVDEPEECIFLLDSSLQSAGFWMLAPVYSYCRWLTEQDLGSAYLAYRDHLRLFQASAPDARLTLKAPAHAGGLQALLDAIPDACVVLTSRDPVEVLSSTNSLFSSLHGGVADQIDLQRMASLNARLLEWILQGAQVARRQHRERVLDVDYQDLLRSPLDAVHRVHEYFGLGWDSESERRMREWLEARPQHKLGKHEYRADDFGMTDQEIAERFAQYFLPSSPGPNVS